MHKSFITLCFLLGAGSLQTYAQVNGKNVHKALLNIFSYSQDGKLLKSGTAFFIDKNANAVTSYDILKDAYKAEIIDCKGKKYEVLRILGADASANIVKFTTSAPHDNNFLQITSEALNDKDHVQVWSYSSQKNSAPLEVAITATEPYNQYKYYQTSLENNKTYNTCPLIKDNGILAAIVQHNVNPKATTACAIDSRFIHELKISETSSFNTDLQSINIPKELPDQFKDALTYIYTYPVYDSVNNYEIALDDFIRKFPHIADGYINRSSYWAPCGQYAKCEADFETAIQKATTDTTGATLDYVYYHIGNTIYHSYLSKNDTTEVYPNWNLARASAEVQRAYDLNQNSLYLLTYAQIAFARKRYNESYTAMSQVCKDKKFATPENFFFTAQVAELCHADTCQVISLLDQCISSLQQPVLNSDAFYYLERAKRLQDAKRYRDAAFDLFEYEKIVGPNNLTAEFYYMKQQIEMNARMYQQALDDIRTAISKSGRSVFYRTEEAYLLMRVGEFDAAIQAAKNILTDNADNIDCFKILGISYGAKNQKSEALRWLNKAKESGDETVEPIIQQYQTK